MIRELQYNESTILIYEILGKITLQEEKLWLEQLEKVISEGKKLRIMLILGEESGWSFSAGVEDLKWILKNYSEFEKVAIVSESKVWEWYVRLDFIAKLSGVQEHHFLPDEVQKGVSWLSQ